MAGFAQTPQVPMQATLFGCFDDFGDCCYSCFCQPCHLGSIAQKTGSGDMCGTCCVAVFLSFPLIYQCYAKGVVQSALYRVGVNKPIGCCECVFCWSCVQCQASREINNRQSQMAVSGGARAQTTQVIVVQAPAPVAASK